MHTIGVLDSGIGGLTTCYYIFRQIPQINVIYYADNKNAPYGDKSEGEVYRAARVGTEYLIDQKCGLIVLACNSATAAAVSRLREEFCVPIVGTEPAVKQSEKVGGSTLYLATPLTAKKKNTGSCKLADTSLLAPLIEKLYDDERLMRELAKRLIDGAYDNVVLGCTHYLFLKKYIAELYPDTRIFDGGEGVAKQVGRLLPTSCAKRGGKLFLHFSGESCISAYMNAFDTFARDST